MNCSRGDLAIIIRDEPGCETNVGRIVIVTNKGLLEPRFGWMWSIRPLDHGPMLCIDNSTEKLIVSMKAVYHQDDWLRSIRPELEQDAIERLASTVLEQEMQ